MPTHPGKFSASGRLDSFFARAGFPLAVLSLLAAMASGLGSRLGLWDFRTGFRGLQWAGYGATAAILLCAAGLAVSRPGKSKRGFYRSALGLLIGTVLVGSLLSWFWTARHVPPIHDITTDPENPPRFVSVLPLRRNAPNPAEYGGAELAEKQRAGYPDLKPALLSVPPDQAFNRALSASRELGWEIVDANPAAGRIEATDTTFWFGFKDDIVVRVTPIDGGSRVDVRSVSRVGKSDVGTNAKRIGQFLERLKGEP